ncbi:MAG: type II toxin-antitoxin system RelE/ParE family toxin [Syntrophaceae bacterium]|nr:type II toxin-antitoxin system RelE/ParE family toxin [Syntrophaceae bacterium]
MAEYKIFFRQSVEKDFRVISNKNLKKILFHIESLEKNPKPSGHEKLTEQDRYRVRQGKYRIVYSIQDKEPTVWVVKVGHRKDVYREIK